MDHTEDFDGGADRRGLTFPIAMDRIVMWLSAALLGWLCYSTMTMREQMVMMIERSVTYKEQQANFQQQQDRQDLVVNRLSLELKHLQVNAAQHGWKEDPSAR